MFFYKKQQTNEKDLHFLSFIPLLSILSLLVSIITDSSSPHARYIVNYPLIDFTKTIEIFPYEFNDFFCKVYKSLALRARQFCHDINVRDSFKKRETWSSLHSL